MVDRDTGKLNFPAKEEMAGQVFEGVHSTARSAIDLVSAGGSLKQSRIYTE